MSTNQFNSASDPGDREGQPMSDAQRHEQFTVLFARHVEQLQAYIGTLVPHAANADEVFQETSITLWHKYGEFRPDGNFAAWACGVAFNVIRNFRRTESRRRTFLLDDALLEQLGQVQIESRQRLVHRREALADCLARLSPTDQELIERSYGSSDNMAAVAANLGRSANSLYKRLKVLRGLLFDCINRAQTAEGGRS
jgi:RNA polymerase sigma-70 factor (ECF subfamily)